MEVNQHIIFSQSKAPELVKYLQEHNISFTDAHGIMSLDIFQSDTRWESIRHYVQKYKLVCLCETLFSAEELNAAQWLMVRSKWRNGYPQPEGKFAYEEITYDGSLCNHCGIGLRQKNPFRIKATPKWGNRHFMMLNWVEDELFLTDYAKNYLLEQGFTGFTFTEVQNKNGTCAMHGIHQMSISTETKPGFVNGQRNVQNVYVCPLCGQMKYHPSGIGMYAFQKEALDNMPDICRTFEHFGWGKSAHRMILIRQDVYRAITSNHMDRGLVFSPLDLK